MDSEIDLTEGNQLTTIPVNPMRKFSSVPPWRRKGFTPMYFSTRGNRWTIYYSDTNSLTSYDFTWDYEDAIRTATAINGTTSTQSTPFWAVKNEEDLNTFSITYFDGEDDYSGNTVDIAYTPSISSKRNEIDYHRARKSEKKYRSLFVKCIHCGKIVHLTEKQKSRLCRECNRSEYLDKSLRKFKKLINKRDYYDNNRYNHVKLVRVNDRSRFDRKPFTNWWVRPVSRIKERAVRYKDQTYRGRGRAWQPKGRVPQEYDDMFERLDWRELLAEKEIGE